ncbi:hypothetical protein, partial [Thalassotalea sp. ND16A]|uniref:hypothetical protein n=1 Tax=Thalassotalea sp. ND16A TaxID=1535422 RepID=UPI001F1596DD
MSYPSGMHIKLDNFLKFQKDMNNYLFKISVVLKLSISFSIDQIIKRTGIEYEKRRTIVSMRVLNLGGPVQKHNGMPVISFCQISKLEKLCLDHIFCDSPLSGTLSSISFSQECK